ncbi:hypothetical protein GCM10027190_35770 [Spirosoma areae]
MNGFVVYVHGPVLCSVLLENEWNKGGDWAGHSDNPDSGYGGKNLGTLPMGIIKKGTKTVPTWVYVRLRNTPLKKIPMSERLNRLRPIRRRPARLDRRNALLAGRIVRST